MEQLLAAGMPEGDAAHEVAEWRRTSDVLRTQCECCGGQCAPHDIRCLRCISRGVGWPREGGDPARPTVTLVRSYSPPPRLRTGC